MCQAPSPSGLPIPLSQRSLRLALEESTSTSGQVLRMPPVVIPWDAVQDGAARTTGFIHTNTIHGASARLMLVEEQLRCHLGQIRGAPLTRVGKVCRRVLSCEASRSSRDSTRYGSGKSSSGGPRYEGHRSLSSRTVGMNRPPCLRVNLVLGPLHQRISFNSPTLCGSVRVLRCHGRSLRRASVYSSKRQALH